MDSREEPQNASDSMRVNSESILNEIDENDEQPRKQDEQQMH
jgi:hypothetical protein